MPLNKAPGPDNILTEMLVASGEAGLTEITSRYDVPRRLFSRKVEQFHIHHFISTELVSICTLDI